MEKMDTIKVLRTTDSDFEEEFINILFRREEVSAEIEKVVKDILRDVKEKGDEALFKYAEKFDQTKLDSASIVVSSEEIERGYDKLSKEEIDALRLAAVRIEKFHQRKINQITIKGEKGEYLTEIVSPLNTVGLYVPGGKAAYPSSVLMSAIPARVAGVKEIVIVSPTVSSHVLAAAKIAGVNHIYRIGGAQAIAALAFGTESIKRVDKIVGPGNVYVETAKRLVYGEVGLDMVAGPSEILVIADDSGVPSFAAADLLAQAEHDEDARPMLIALSKKFLQEAYKETISQLADLTRKDIAKRSIEKQGVMILARDINEAVELANRIAPEHLVLMIDKPDKALKKITCAGAVFLGNYTPVTVGDYMAGPSHILPTAGTARFFSPLGVEDFVRRMSVISFSQESLKNIEKEVKRLALIEGLDAHAKAVEKRTKS
jgi:histidinol dehydrogenase